MVDLGMGGVTHSFLVIPECPYLLLGRDLLFKVGAQIHFHQDGWTVTNSKGEPLQVLTMRLEEEHWLYEVPKVTSVDMQDWMTRFLRAWAERAGMGTAEVRTPVIVEIKAAGTPIAVQQYPMSKEAQDGIWTHILRLLEQGMLV